MSLQWTLIAGFLYFEIAVVIILILPIVNPRRWQRLFNSDIVRRIGQYSYIYFYVLLGVLALFLFDSVREIRKYSNLTDHVNLTAEMKGSIRLFRAQRNFYITFFTIFFSFIIKRLITILDVQASLLSKSEAIIKEAETAKNLANRTIKDHENLITIEKKNQENVVNTLKEELEKTAHMYEMEKLKCSSVQSDFELLSNELKELKDRFDIAH